MAKVASLVFLISLLLLSSSLALLARPEPPFRKDATPAKTKLLDATDMEESGGIACEGVGDESEECLVRRTLAAHLDYIYTQEQKP